METAARLFLPLLPTLTKVQEASAFRGSVQQLVQRDQNRKKETQRGWKGGGMVPKQQSTNQVPIW